jgi:glycine oxidase
MLDYIIVGQGIAGSVLAMTLIKRNKKILVIDENENSTSSKVAAGLYNPIVFKRLVKSWEADTLLPFADAFYSSLEKEFNDKFYFKKRIVKIFADEQERNFWEKKRKEEGSYIMPAVSEPYQEDAIVSPFGYAEVTGSGNLDVLKFLHYIREYLVKNNLFLAEKFEHNDIELENGKVKYHSYESERIIFCQGYKSITNPLFKDLPFKLTKGELLTLRIPELSLDKVVNKGVFILPLGDHLYKVGATYEWQDLNEEISQKGKEELLEKLKRIINSPFEIISQQAGVRPTVNDRRPIIGMHPDYPQAGILNGMGTKGVMLAPYFANQLIKHIEEGTELNKEADIKRFKV